MLNELKNYNSIFLRKGSIMFRKINIIAVILTVLFGLYPNYGYALSK